MTQATKFQLKPTNQVKSFALGFPVTSTSGPAELSALLTNPVSAPGDSNLIQGESNKGRDLSTAPAL